MPKTCKHISENACKPAGNLTPSATINHSITPAQVPNRSIIDGNRRFFHESGKREPLLSDDRGGTGFVRRSVLCFIKQGICAANSTQNRWAVPSLGDTPNTPVYVETNGRKYR